MRWQAVKGLLPWVVLAVLLAFTREDARARPTTCRFLWRGRTSACCAPWQPVDVALLHWKFAKDRPFFQEISTETVQDMKVLGQTVKQVQKQTIYLRFWPIEEDQAGLWRMAVQIIGIRTSLDIGGNIIDFDSITQPQVRHPLTDFFRVLMAKEFQIALGPDLRLRKIEGREELVKELAAHNPATVPLLQKMLFPDSAFQSMTAAGLVPLPYEPLRKGDFWTTQREANYGPIGLFQTRSRYTYHGLEKDLDKIKVDIELQSNKPGAQRVPLTRQHGGGEVCFDRTKGRVRSSQMTVCLAIKTCIDVSGREEAVDLEVTQKTTTRFTDKNPLKQ